MDMTQPGGRSTGGNSHVIATAAQDGRTAVVATGGPTSGIGVEAIGTGTGVGLKATGTGGAAIVANNSSTAEALKVNGDTVSTTAAIAPLFIAPLNNQPSGAHLVGHMYVTTGGVLKICTVAGTPGTWVSVGTQT